MITAQCVSTIEVLQLQLPAKTLASFRSEAGTCDMFAEDRQRYPVFSVHPRDQLPIPPSLHVVFPETEDSVTTHRGSTDCQGSGKCGSASHGPSSGCHKGPPPASAELVAVTPGRELRPQRIPDAYQLQSFTRMRKPDIRGTDSLPGVAEQPLTLFHSFPAFL
jgi:hypothetical protein